MEAQVLQLRQALAVAGPEDKPALLQIISDLEHLISLSTNSSESSSSNNVKTETGSANSNNAEAETQETDEDEEFRRFQEEMKALESNEDENNLDNGSSQGLADSNENSLNVTDEESLTSGYDSIRDELAALEGMKCKAPYEHHWGQVGYYNGIVFCVEPISEDSSSMDSILVRVIFTQPMSDSMRPCPFFMEGRCRFEEGCKYSHGEVVSLAHLQEYKEPDFSSLASGSRVLAKYSDDLWYRATISRILESGDCELRFDSYPETVTIPLHETFPLHTDYTLETDCNFDNSSGSDSDNEVDLEEEPSEPAPIIWSNMTGKTALGHWEQHTRGIGSKLMVKMGYVLGTGLGRYGEGRVDPVDAVIVPPGMSLDKCMELRERAGSSGQNIFSVERRLKRIQKKEQLRARQEDEKTKQSQSMFSFLNSKLNLSKENKAKLQQQQGEVNKDSCQNLSKKLLQLGASVRQVNKDIVKCKEGMKRHEGRDKTTVDKLKAKLTNLQQHLVDLNKAEVRVSNEQKNRSDKKKLSIF